MTNSAQLLVDSNRGVYVPQMFAKGYQHYIVNAEDLKDSINDLLEGPDNENYWDSWTDVLDNAKIVDDFKLPGILYENDGDLWYIPESEVEDIPEH